MRICIPTETDGGAASSISRHFGRAPLFTIVDTETGDVHALRNPHPGHVHGHFDPVSALGSENLDAVVVAGIGGGALRRLRSAGMPTYLTTADTVDQVMEAVRSGGLGSLGADRTQEPGLEFARCNHHEA